MSTVDKFLQNFLFSSDEMIKDIHERIIVIESSREDFDSIDALFRTIHSLKGNATFFALTTVKTMAHAIEDLLAEYRGKRIMVDDATVVLLWEGMRLIKGALDVIRKGEFPQQLEAAERKYVDLVKQQRQTLITQEAAATAAVPARRYRYQCDDVDVTVPIEAIQRLFLQDITRPCSAAVRAQFSDAVVLLAEILHAQGRHSEQQTVQKMQADYEMMASDDGIMSEFLLHLLTESFQTVLGVIKRVELTEVKVKGDDVTIRLETAKPSFRIEEEKIDTILNTARRFDEVKRSFITVRDAIKTASIEKETLFQFQQAINVFDYLHGSMVQLIMKLKTTSPGLFLEKVEQIIMSLARSCNKKIVIETKGKNVFVERVSMEVLEEVLLHMVRNCIDHGIEMPHERSVLGKPEEGRVSIELRESDDELQITVGDDGKGIDFGALRACACRKGLITEDERMRMNDEESVKLLFMPGVSTSAAVSDISGRGVGMDAIANSLKKVKGSIVVRSRVGQGTTFIISLPKKG